ncbi:heterokaryon incompatibility protein-domain-containing protein [Xylariaceae sp. FL0662B]|nr:heterokaryon incompatibility protein-domain-containing protein [Xylariaceae sp. FL0662B]
MSLSRSNLSPNRKGAAKDGRRSPMATIATGLANQLQPAVKKTWEEGVLLRRPKEWVMPFLSNQYHYEPLPSPSCIRLLRIEPGSPGEMIQCSLYTVDLNARPRYTALSYSWVKDTPLSSWAADISKGMLSSIAKTVLGNFKLASQSNADEGGESPQTILCDGKSMTVYPNLYNALLQFRRSDPGDYWIDAVCINQADLVERNAQVQMMGRIYSSAAITTIWLGTCPQLLSPGIARLEKFKDNLSEIDESEEYSSKESFGIATSQWTYIAAGYLLLRRYFTRLWVLQEACLAKEIAFRLGDHRLSPATFAAALHWIGGASESDRVKLKGLGNFLRPWARHIRLIPVMLDGRGEFQQGTKWSLEQWLHVSRGRKTLDPRDFVNAGLSLVKSESLEIDQSILLDISPTARQSQVHDPITKRKLWPRLHADYVAEASEVFWNLAACLLSQPNPTKLLSIASRSRSYEAITYGNYKDIKTISAVAHLPSWVPIPGSLASHMSDTFAAQGGAHFSACSTNLRNTPKISPDGTALFMDAARLGTIEHVNYCAYLLPESCDEMIKFLEFITGIPRKYSPSGQWGLSAFAHVLVAGIWGDEQQHPPPRETVIGLVQYLDTQVRIFARKLDKEIKEKQETKIGTRAVQEGIRLLSKSRTSRASLQAKREELQRVYAKVKETYPNQSWPAPGEKTSAEAADLRSRFEMAAVKALGWRSTFITREGYLGLGPWGLAKGDAVMLVKGGYVPYVFTPVGEDQRKKAQEIEERLQKNKTLLEAEEREFLERELAYFRRSMQTAHGWVLVGESYVQGVMMGEAVNDTTAFERISIV